MENERLMELLRRAHTVIGEGLIDNALDESAAELQNEIAEALGLPLTKRDTVRCSKTWFVAGGRDSRQCRENAEPDAICAECGAARCEEHTDISFEEVEGRVLCEDCVGHGGKA
ncbi:MAG: hypothetical protein WBV36_04705 [Terriglobales bacterium]